MAKTAAGETGIRGMYRGAKFVKFGDFTIKMLIWHTVSAGYFPTTREGRLLGDGRSLGELVIPPAKLEAALAGK